MKGTKRIILALAIITTTFITVYAQPAVAEDGSPDGMATEGSPHPCTLLNTRKANLEIAEEERDEAWDKYVEKKLGWEDLQNSDLMGALEREFRESNSDVWAYDCGDWSNCSWVDGGEEQAVIACYQRYYACRLEWIIQQLEIIVQELRDSGNSERADRTEELLDQVRSWHEDLVDAYEALVQAWNELKQAYAQVGYFHDRVVEAERECDLTRTVTSMTEHPWDSQTPKPMSTFDNSMLEQMRDPMGSEANRASNETHSVIPFGVVQQQQPPQTAVGQVVMPETETSAVTPSRARLFNVLPERSTPSAGQDQSTPAATGQIMQVQQPGSANTGTSSFGYTHMPLPQETTQSATAVAPQKTLRAVTPLRRMHMRPGRSINR